jgi:toxin-antitoxin system PIN domain toxin
VKYLADVNVLIALAWANHEAHAKVRAWWAKLGNDDALATCAITELGFVRVSLQTAAVVDINLVKQAMLQLRKARPGHLFLADDIGADLLPSWVKSAKHTTDGHLASLASAHGAKLVTLDAGIPGAVLL